MFSDFYNLENEQCDFYLYKLDINKKVFICCWTKIREGVSAFDYWVQYKEQLQDINMTITLMSAGLNMLEL